MNFNTNYTPDCYVDLRKNHNCCFDTPSYPPQIPPHPPKPECKNQKINIEIDSSTLIAFMLGYIISKNCK